jgi:hypothetical protein
MGNWKQEPQSLLPTAEPTRDDVLFFAGFYDGEGSACRQGNNSIVVQVPQKDPELLYRARSLWGGSIRVNGVGISVWVMSGDRARRFLQAIYPHLSSRRKEQIEKAGGLLLTGKGSATVGGITQERREARAKMTTDAERHHETSYQYYLRNKDKMHENSRRWSRDNRERVNARQRERRRKIHEQQVSAQNELHSERSVLVN